MVETKLDSSPMEQWSELFRWLRETGRAARVVSRLRMKYGLLIVQDDKIISDFKDGRHRTIYIDREKRILGVHWTREGGRNIHEDVVEYDIGKLRQEDEDIMQRLSWRKVEVGDKHFSDLRIEVAKEQWESLELYRVHGKEVEIDSEAERKLSANMERLNLEEFNRRNTALGPVFNQNWGIVFRHESLAGLLFWDPKGLYYKDFELYGRLRSKLLESVRI